MFKRKSTDLEAAVIEAARLRAELHRPRVRPKLTGEAFSRECLALAQCGPEAVEDLERMLAERRGELWHGLRFTLDRMKKMIADGNTSSPVRRCSAYFSGANAEQQLGLIYSLGLNEHAVQCVAIRQVREERPECFGDVESLAALGQERAELEAKYTAALEAIAAAVRIEDLELTRDAAFFRAWPSVRLAADFPEQLARAENEERPARVEPQPLYGLPSVPTAPRPMM